jgi:Ca2+-binding RTX toxin-like protein
MIGGSGNDLYVVDNSQDIIIENPDEGIDTVHSFLDYVLGDNLENLVLRGNLNLNGTGNSFNNRLIGNDGNNTLIGGSGADILIGKGGLDIYAFQFGDSTSFATDRIISFKVGIDKISLLETNGTTMAAPIGLSRAADSSTMQLETIIAQIFTDADGATPGNQALGANTAALVQANQAAYLIVNDNQIGFQANRDLVINITTYLGTLPTLGAVSVDMFFA